MSKRDIPALVSTGVAGLDHLLNGGLPSGRMYLVEGHPGAGKTTLALQFLMAGREAGENGIYVTLSETEDELRAIGKSHGWDLDGITICDLQGAEASLQAEAQYTLFHPSEVELSETTQQVLKAVERERPARVVFDSLSEMRLLARDSLRYRRQLLALKQYFAARGATVLLLDTDARDTDYQISSIAFGVICMEALSPEYGGDRRRLRVAKVRGMSYDGGYHDYRITTGGLKVYPRLSAASSFRDGHAGELASSGIGGLDALAGGGIPRGTSTLFVGATGTGKSTLIMQYVQAAAQRGEGTAVFLFDETVSTWRARGEGLGMKLEPFIEKGLIRIESVNAAERSPGEFAYVVRRAVEKENVRHVVIDSLNGYLAAMPEENFLVLHLHELLSYTGKLGVCTFMTMVQHGLVGEAVTTPFDVSYIADNVFHVRYFEAFGQVRKALSVVKKRQGPHEHTIREIVLTSDGLAIGEQLVEFSGILSGHPSYHGKGPNLLDGHGTARAD